MKKIVIGLILAGIGSVSLAHPRYGYYDRYNYHRPAIVERDWVTPLIIGGIAGAVIMREASRPTVVIQEVPVIVQEPLPSNSVIIDGKLYIRQMMQIDGIWREVMIQK
jgi:hypothetical protein